MKYTCRECWAKLSVRYGEKKPLDLKHKPSCSIGIRLAQKKLTALRKKLDTMQKELDARIKERGEWGEFDYEIEPGWYHGESLQGFSRGGSPVLA